MSRLIALDTETTGLSPAQGDRIVEIGCVELVQMRKGQTRQWFVNPERKIPLEATRIHGITDEKVANAPVFSAIAGEFLDFIGDDGLVIHNAAFDLGFLNAELSRVRRPILDARRVTDTMLLSRRRFPGAAASLDAVCKRMKIDISHRKLHGALLDAELLADLYVALHGGAQFAMALGGDSAPAPRHAVSGGKAVASKVAVVSPVTHPARDWPLSPEEEEAHVAYLARMQQEFGACLWTNY
ncbi:MAG: DNA polymerase III subunit epsilon [Magnetococcales bacterium]|nr:DNA polymerase III subunit epsilon [Magnetococcales bacterium]